MPGYKRSRNFRRRRPFYKKRRYGVVKAIKKLTRRVAGEVKKCDVAVTTAATIGFGGSVWYLCPIAQGDGTNGREGNQIRTKSLFLNGYVQYNGSGDDDQVAVDIVLDTLQDQGTNVAVTDIFNTANPMDPLNSNHVGRYKILYHRFFTIDSINHNSFKLHLFKYMSRFIRFYGSNSGDIQRNGLYLVMRTNQTTNAPKTTWTTRLNYYDN